MIALLSPLLATTARKIISGVMLALIILLAFLWLTRGNKEQAKQDVRSANAVAETAKDAAKTVIERAGKDATVDDLVEQTAKEIDNAPNDKAAGDAARRAICDILSNCGNDTTR